jgi:hypothetical protein
MKLGDTVDVEIVGLTVGFSVVFLYTCYLHWTLKKVKAEIIGMISNLEDLDIKSKHLELWSHKIYRWIDTLGGKKGE